MPDPQAFVPARIVPAELLGRIYDAATSPPAWEDALDLGIAHVGARSGALMTYDVGDPSSYTVAVQGRVVRETIRDRPGLMQRWMDEFAPLEWEAHEFVQTQPARRLWVDTDIWPDAAALRARPDYAFLEEIAGVGTKLFTRLNDNPLIHETFAFHFLPGETVDPARRAAFASLLPHFAKAAEMNVLYARLQRRYDAALGALDRVGIGLMVLDGAGRTVVANTEARRILDAGHGLRERADATLTCDGAAERAALARLLHDASPVRAREPSHAEGLLVLRRAPDAEPLIVEVSPLRDGLDELAMGIDGTLVQMVDTDSRHRCSIDAFALAYALTEAEAAVAALVLDGLTNPEIAETRGTGVDTVKAQVGGVLAKAGARSRVELVRRILKTRPPIE